MERFPQGLVELGENIFIGTWIKKEFLRKDRFVLVHYRTKELLKYSKWEAKFYLIDKTYLTDEHN